MRKRLVERRLRRLGSNVFRVSEKALRTGLCIKYEMRFNFFVYRPNCIILIENLRGGPIFKDLRVTAKAKSFSQPCRS